MATLNLLGFSLGLPAWFLPTLNVPHVPDVSHMSTSYQEHQNNFNPLSSSLLGSVPHPSTSYGERLIPSSQSSNKNRRNKNKKKARKQPITTSHTGNGSPASPSHVGDMQPATASHVGGNQPIIVSHDGGKQPVVASHDGGKREGIRLKFPCTLCQGDHLTLLCPSMDKF